MSTPNSAPLAHIHYPSLAALQAAHNELLKLNRQERDSPAMLAAAYDFLRAGTLTGTLLDEDADRRAAQSLLDYWAARLYRVDADPPDTTLAEFDPLLAPELPDNLCPYLGLEAFREADHTRFFGRESLLADMVKRLADHRMLAVVGPSGSGKSSVVRAGLLPALKGGALPSSQRWHYLPPIVPGSDPMRNLARIIPSIQEPRTGDQERNRLLDSTMVLVVDQFEELFTLCEDANARQAFTIELLRLAKGPGAVHRIILTMRSDFEGFVAWSPALQTLFNTGRVQVTPLSAGDLREAIERPADRIGLKFEAGVVDALLQDILGEPAALPLLQFTLLKLWEDRARNRITREAYRAVGGGRLALAHSADQFYDALIPEEQITARRILLRMVRPGEGLEITSSRIRRADLHRGGEDPGRIERVLDKLIATRLVRLTEGDIPDDEQVEVAHEALVRNWPTLVNWLEQEKAAIATRQRLEGRAAEWVRLGQGAGGLLDEVELHEAERWLQSAEATYLGYDSGLPALVAASQETIAQAEAEKEAARQRELKLAQTLATEQATRAQRLRRATLALIALLTLALMATGVALVQQSNAQQQRQVAETAQARAQQDAHAAQTAQIDAQNQQATTLIAQAQAQQQSDERATAQARVQQQLVIVESQQLAFAAQGELDSAPETALLLAYEGAMRDNNQISQQVLHEAIDHISWKPTVLQSNTDTFWNAVFSPDGKRILTASVSGTAQMWDLNGKSQIILQGHTDSIWGAVFSPDGKYILTFSADSTARLWDASGKSLIIFRGHTAAVYGGVFSSDGKHILTTSADGTARLWDLSGQSLIIFRGHTAAVYSAVFNPDGKHILTTSADGTARLWDVNGTLLTTLQGHTDQIRSAVFSPDGERILTASNDRTAQLWDLNGTPLITLQGHTDAVFTAVFSPDNQSILTASADGTARLWDVNGKSLAILQGHTNPILNAVFSYDGNNILTASADGTARLWNRSGSLLAILQGHTNKVYDAIFSPDGQHILTSSFDGTTRLWDQSDASQPTFRAHTAGVSGVIFSPDGKRALTASFDNTARLWDINGTNLVTLGHSGVVWSAEFSPDGQRILTSSEDGTARLWDASGQGLSTFQGHTGGVRSAVFSPDGQHILTSSEDDTARLWNLNGTVLAILRGHTGVVWSALFSPDGQYILTASEDGTARLWDLSGTVLAILRGHTDAVSTAVFSSDGQRILTSSEDGAARLWDLSGTTLVTFQGHTGGISTAVFSPDDQHILTASDDGTARLWNLNGTLLAILQGHTGPVYTAMFSPDGKHILTTSTDRTTRLWNWSGTLIATLQGHTDTVWFAIFSPDGKRILTASDDGTARQYLVNLDDLLAVAACLVGRGLTNEEIQRFQVPIPLKFDFAHRQCPPALGQ